MKLCQHICCVCICQAWLRIHDLVVANNLGLAWVARSGYLLWCITARGMIGQPTTAMVAVIASLRGSDCL